MTEQEKIRKLAHWMGWHKSGDIMWVWMDAEGYSVAGSDWNPFTLDAQGLCAARMLEDEIGRKALRWKYVNHLVTVILGESEIINPYILTAGEIYMIAHAEPAQKSEAVLKLIGEKS